MPKNSAEVRELEADAYLAVLKAFAIVAPSWERFNILTELEKELNIDSTAKQRLQQESMTDARVLVVQNPGGEQKTLDSIFCVPRCPVNMTSFLQIFP